MAPSAEVVLSIEEQEEISLEDQRAWLVNNSLYQDGLTEEEVTRRYKVFQSIEFGEYSFKNKQELFQDLLPLEQSFAAYQDDIGCVKDWPFSMRVKPGPLIRQRPIQYAPNQRAFIKEQMKTLLNKGVLEPATDQSHLHRVVLVPGREDRPGQSGQDYRLATDFRAINQRTYPEPFPPADLADCIRRIQGCYIYCSIDLKAGFHNVPIEEWCRDFCGLVTQDGSYRFARLQFGLINAPAWFQKVVVSIVDLGDTLVVVYLDDICIYGNDPQKVWSDCLLTLRRLSEAGFMINIKKSKFLVGSLKLLGFKLDKGILKPNFVTLEAKLETITKKAPSTRRELQSLYGLMSYFRVFIPNFAELVKPISDLMRVDTVDPAWTATHATIVKLVLKKLVDHMGLKIPDPVQPFVLEILATEGGYGGVLLQEDAAKKLWPVACTSTTNTWVSRSDAEDALSATLYAVRKFKDLLRITKQIEVRTPTAGLTALLRSRDHGARLQSVLGELLAYPIQFKHEPALRQKLQQALELPDDEVGFQSTPIRPVANSPALKRYQGKHLLVAFDGGYASGVGTIGIQLQNSVNQENLLIVGFHDAGSTNNEAECLACLKALEVAVKGKFHKKFDFIRLQGDSQLVFNYLTKVWRVHQPLLNEIMVKIRKLLRKFSLKIEYHWVRREFNKVADSAALQARQQSGDVVIVDKWKVMDTLETCAKLSEEICAEAGCEPVNRDECVQQFIVDLYSPGSPSDNQIFYDSTSALGDVQDFPVFGISLPQRRKIQPQEYTIQTPIFPPFERCCFKCGKRAFRRSSVLEIFCNACALELVRKGSNDPVEDIPLLYFIYYGRHHSQVRSEQARRVNQIHSHYKLVVLPPKLAMLRVTAEGDRVIPAVKDRPTIMMDVHLQNGHAAPQRLQTLLSSSYWWPSMRANCFQVYATCEACQREIQVFNKALPLTPCDHPTMAFEGWSVDLITSLKESIEGFNHAAVAICCHSRWPEIGPLRTKESSEVARWFYETIIARYGCPRWIRVDAGGEFEGTFKQMADALGITLRVTTPHNPQANGQVERLNKEIKKGIRKYLSSFIRSNQSEGLSVVDWVDSLPAILCGLRFTTHSTTRFSPHFLAFKQPGVWPGLGPDPWAVITEPLKKIAGTTEQNANYWLRLFQNVAAQLPANQDKANKKMTKAFNKAKTLIRWPPYLPGELLWIKQPQVGKLLPRSLGPYPVARQTEKTVTVRTGEGSTRKISKAQALPVNSAT